MKNQVDTALYKSFLNHQQAFKPVLNQIEGLNITTADKLKYIKNVCYTETNPTLTVKIIQDSVNNYPKSNQPMDDLINHTAKLCNNLPCVKTADPTIIHNSTPKLYHAMNKVPDVTSFLGNSLKPNSPYKLEDIRTGLSNALQEGDLPNLIDICTFMAKNENVIVLLSTGCLAGILGIVLTTATNFELEIKKCQINRIQFNGSWDFKYQLLKNYYITNTFEYVYRALTSLIIVLSKVVGFFLGNYIFFLTLMLILHYEQIFSNAIS